MMTSLCHSVHEGVYLCIAEIVFKQQHGMCLTKPCNILKLRRVINFASYVYESTINITLINRSLR